MLIVSDGIFHWNPFRPLKTRASRVWFGYYWLVNGEPMTFRETKAALLSEIEDVKEVLAEMNRLEENHG